jgi:hypothetical protein
MKNRGKDKRKHSHLQEPTPDYAYLIIFYKLL